MSFPCRASRRLLTESCHARGIHLIGLGLGKSCPKESARWLNGVAANQNVRDHARLNKYMDGSPDGFRTDQGGSIPPRPTDGEHPRRQCATSAHGGQS